MNNQICQGSEYARDREGSEYMWVCSWTMLKYAWMRLKQNLKSLYKLHNNYRYIWLFRMLPSILTGLGRSAYQKIIMARIYFRKILQFVWQGCKYRRTFEYSRVLNMTRITNVPGFRVCQGLWLMKRVGFIFVIWCSFWYKN